MQDRQLYAEILGIQAPWFVDRVELKLTDGDVHVHRGPARGTVQPAGGEHLSERGRLVLRRGPWQNGRRGLRGGQLSSGPTALTEQRSGIRKLMPAILPVRRATARG